jgi:hypothetical protein
MSSALGWAMAVLGTALGWHAYGWRGVALAVSVIVFWLLLQFSRTLRVMRAAGQAPVGHVANAVMLHARLRPGLRLLEILALTRSLGEKLGDDPERYAWCDAGGDRVTLELESGRLARWQLDRAPAPGDAGTGA